MFLFPVAQRALLAVVAVLVVVAPMPSLRYQAVPEDAGAAATNVYAQPAELRDPDVPKTQRFADETAGLAITPPGGWVRGPDSALNPVSDPPEPVQEVARFQIRVGDADLYAAPIAITSGLVADAIAVISIGVAREGSGIPLMERSVRRDRELGSIPGFTTREDETTYEGLHVLTRYLYSRDSARVLVVRAATADNVWSAFEPALRASIATFTGDPLAANAPAPAPPPPPPAPEPVVVSDPTVAIRDQILARAAGLLGLRYVWGGNSTSGGMDCSAYVSWAWSVSRYTTESIWNVAFPIAKDELRPGDAVNLTIGRDPARFGHIRIFEAWANAEHTALWAYEETPPRAVHRVVAYDSRYQPIRLAGLSGAGEARLVPGAPAADPTFAPTARRTPTPTRRPTPRPTPRPTYRTSTPRPTNTLRPSATPTATARTTTGTFAPTASPTRTPTATPRPTTKP